MDYKRIYDYRFRGVNQAKRVSVWQEISNYIYQILGSPQRVLDPAAGRCEFLNAIDTIDIIERWAVDMDPSVVDYAQDGVKSVVSNIFEAELPENHFDGVFISNFLEHLESPERCFDFLTKMRSSLATGGKIVIMGPNFKYCSQEYFDCADHNLILTHIAIEELLYSANFKLVKSYSKFLPYSFRGLLPPSPLLTRLYLKMPFAWKLLGKQFLIVAEKK